MITYKIEHIMDDGECVGFLFQFDPAYAVLEEFFYSDVANFPSLIHQTLTEAVQRGQKTFAGNACVLKATKGESTIVPLFSDEKDLKIATSELVRLVKAYLAYKRSYQA